MEEGSIMETWASSQARRQLHEKLTIFEMFLLLSKKEKPKLAGQEQRFSVSIPPR